MNKVVTVPHEVVSGYIPCGVLAYPCYHPSPNSRRTHTHTHTRTMAEFRRSHGKGKPKIAGIHNYTKILLSLELLALPLHAAEWSAAYP